MQMLVMKQGQEHSCLSGEYLTQFALFEKVQSSDSLTQEMATKSSARKHTYSPVTLQLSDCHS